MRRQKLVLAVVFIALLAVGSGAWAIPPYIAWMSPPDGATVSGISITTVYSFDWAGDVLWVDFYAQMQWDPYYSGLIGTALGHDAEDRWSVSTPTQYYPDGPYSVWAVAHDDDNESNQTTPVTIYINNTNPGPYAWIFSPYDGQVLQGTISSTGVAGASVGLSSISGWGMPVDSQSPTLLWSQAASGQTYYWSEDVDTTQYPNGDYWVAALAADTWGRYGWSPWVPVKVRNYPIADLGYGSTRSSPDGTRYSGTECTITGHFEAGTGNLWAVELWVGNVRRFVQTWAPGTGPTTYDASAPFSSTQFPHNSEVTLKACCWTDSWGYREGTKTKIMWNRGYVMWQVAGNLNPVREQRIANTADAALAAMNHGSSGVIHYHTAQNIKDSIPNFGVFYKYGHGSELGFDECVNWPHPDMVFYDDIATAVGNKSAGQCPYVFAFPDHCGSADGDTLRSAFGCVELLGWFGDCVDNDDYADFSCAVWNSLAQKSTVLEARRYAIQVTDNKITNCMLRGGRSDLKLHATY
jgi:hypothetical protein